MYVALYKHFISFNEVMNIGAELFECIVPKRILDAVNSSPAFGVLFESCCIPWAVGRLLESAALSCNAASRVTSAARGDKARAAC